MTYDNQNIFAKILRGEIPCNPIYEDDHILAFNDITPQAPIHVLVIPKGAYVDIADFCMNANNDEQSAFNNAVATIIKDKNLNEKGFRVIANAGDHGGQEVPHYHLHILGGKKLGPMLPD